MIYSNMIIVLECSVCKHLDYAMNIIHYNDDIHGYAIDC